MWEMVGTRSAKKVQAPLEPVPSSPEDGVSLDNVSGFHIVAHCDEEQYFDGGGVLRCYFFDPNVGAWYPCPELDLVVPEDIAKKRGCAWVGIKVHNARGRISWVCDNLPISAGKVTVHATAIHVSGKEI